MNKTEYEKFKQDFNAFFVREGINVMSPKDVDSEPFFSWYPCDCCRRDLGGDREKYIGYNPTIKEITGPYIICRDCVYYNEYGTLDDLTMLWVNRK